MTFKQSGVEHLKWKWEHLVSKCSLGNCGQATEEEKEWCLKAIENVCVNNERIHSRSCSSWMNLVNGCCPGVSVQCPKVHGLEPLVDWAWFSASSPWTHLAHTTLCTPAEDWNKVKVIRMPCNIYEIKLAKQHRDLNVSQCLCACYNFFFIF